MSSGRVHDNIEGEEVLISCVHYKIIEHRYLSFQLLFSYTDLSLHPQQPDMHERGPNHYCPDHSFNSILSRQTPKK